MIARVLLSACLRSFTWSNVVGCRVQRSCKLLGLLRWLPHHLCSTSQPKGKSLCPTPGVGEALLSETGQMNLLSALLVGHGWVSLCQSSARWRARPACEG